MKKNLESPVSGREYPAENEPQVISEMIRLTKAHMEKIYANKKALRQVHAKMHGFLRAYFTIEPDLPQDLRVGVFANPKTFEAFVRYSNGVTEIKHDKSPDTRGVGIKLLNVPGQKLLDTEQDESQDFVLANAKVFFTATAEAFIPLLKRSIRTNLLWKYAGLIFLLKVLDVKTGRRANKARVKCLNPFELDYFSQTPYRFGDETTAVKYRLTPSPDNILISPEKHDFNLCRKNMVATLMENDLSFDFSVQFQTDPVKMPIEDATVEWDSPFIKLATLSIPAQDFDTEEMNRLGDEMTFNIWHSLPEHRPLGSLNRARKYIYQALYKERKGMNSLREHAQAISSDH